MLPRRAFLKALAALPALWIGAALPRLPGPQRLRVLLPSDAQAEPLAWLAGRLGRPLQPYFYTGNFTRLLYNLPLDLISAPVALVPELIRAGELLRLPPLDLRPLGSNWAPGRRPHDPDSAFTLPRDWGYVSRTGYRRGHIFRPPTALLWADDWAIPAAAPNPALSADLLALWLASAGAAALAASAPPPRKDLPWPLRLAGPGEYRLPAAPNSRRR